MAMGMVCENPIPAWDDNIQPFRCFDNAKVVLTKTYQRKKASEAGWSQMLSTLSHRWDTNPRPDDYESSALPAELRWRT
jgi:hypothetical protein